MANDLFDLWDSLTGPLKPTSSLPKATWESVGNQLGDYLQQVFPAPPQNWRDPNDPAWQRMAQAGLGFASGDMTRIEGVPASVEESFPQKLVWRSNDNFDPARYPRIAKDISGERATTSGPRFDAIQSVRSLDNLGFDTASEALGAIREHPDWADRWDVQPGRSMMEFKAHRTISNYIKNSGGHKPSMAYIRSKQEWPTE